MKSLRIASLGLVAVLLHSHLIFANSVSAERSTDILSPIADSFVNSKRPNENQGGTTSYTIQPKASETRVYYVKFDLSSVSRADQATLRLYNTEWNNSATEVTFAVQGVNNDGWAESALTWNNRPTPTGNDLSSAVEVNGGYTDLDVGDFIRSQAEGDGIVSFYVYVDMYWGSGQVWDQRVDLHSRESANPPQLVINTGGQNPTPTEPTPPTNLVATDVTETSVTLNWTASTDDQGVTKYEVLKNSDWDQSVFGTPPASSAVVTGLEPRTTYLFYVKAADADGNFSTNSEAISVKTAGTLDAFTMIREDNFENYNSGTKNLDYYYEQNCEASTSCGTPCSDSPLLVTNEKSRCGSKSLRFVRAYEDKMITGGDYCSARSEIGNYEDAFASYGDDVWIGFSIYIADNFLQDKWTQENVHVFQFKNIDAGGGGNQYGSIITHKVDGVFKYDVAGYGDVADVVLNQWTDVVLHLKYGIDNNGVIEAWIGDQYVKKTGVDFPEKQNCYVKFGTYSDVLLQNDPAHKVYYDEIRFGLAPDGNNYRSFVASACSDPANGRTTTSDEVTKSPTVTPATALAEMPEQIYPNPSQRGIFTLQTNQSDIARLMMYDHQGRAVPVRVSRLDDHRWQVVPHASLSRGLYMVQYTLADGTILRQKVVVEP